MFNKENEFCIIIEKIFRANGFEIEKSQEDSYKFFDFIATSDSIDLAVEVKLTFNMMISDNRYDSFIKRLKTSALKENKVPVLVTSGIVTDREVNTNYEDLLVLDIHNLLFLVKENDSIRNELIGFLEYNVEKLSCKPINDKNITFVPIGEKKAERDFIEEISKWKPKNKRSSKKTQQNSQNIEKGKKQENSQEYERLCTEILESLFANDLTLWKEQRSSNANLFRFDLICKIKNNVDKDFWNTIENHFHTKYIIFEFKNYSKKITQKEIFTTEKYLYAKGLRNVAIIISTKGTDKNADKAIRGVLRESGKVILSFNNNDLVEMLLRVKQGSDPADYLSEKLDNLLIELEK